MAEPSAATFAFATVDAEPALALTAAEDGTAQAPADDKPAATLIPEPSHWSMLLVGAGVLLLPRGRRRDNSVR